MNQMAELDNKIYENWPAYIADKFPSADFVVTETANSSSGGTIKIKSKNGNSTTEIACDFPASGLCRVTFYNPESPLHNAANDKERQRALMYDDYEITNENLKNTDDYLNIPLYFGWTEEATYYKGVLVHSEARFYESGGWTVMWSESKLSWSQKVGCLINLIGWPILIPQHRFIYKRFNSSVTEKRIIQSNIPAMTDRKHGR